MPPRPSSETITNRPKARRGSAWASFTSGGTGARMIVSLGRPIRVPEELMSARVDSSLCRALELRSAHRAQTPFSIGALHLGHEPVTVAPRGRGSMPFLSPGGDSSSPQRDTPPASPIELDSLRAVERDPEDLELEALPRAERDRTDLRGPDVRRGVGLELDSARSFSHPTSRLLFRGLQ